MYRPAGFSDSDGSEFDDFDFHGEKPELSSKKSEAFESISSSKTWLPISTANVPTSPCSPLTSSDMVLAIEAGDLNSVLSCLEVLEVNTELPVWGSGRLTPALLALAKVQPGVLKALVEKGGVCGGEGLLALAGGVDQYSDRESVVECARQVLAMEGEKVDCVQRQGMTPLMLASRGGCEVLVNWLVNNGADLNKREYEGWTALMFSVDRGMGEVARLLLDKGADPMIVNCDGQRVQDIAACGGSNTMQDIIETFCVEKGRAVIRGDETVKKFTEMENVLLGLDLREYVPLFRNHNVGLEEFLLMREADIAGIGVDKVGAVKKLLIGQAEIHKAEWSKSSLPSVTSDHRREGLMLNTATTTAMVANISQHARYMKTNIGYVRQQLRDHGERLLCAGADLVSPHQLLQQVDGCDFHLKMLDREVKLLRKDLSEYSSTRESRSADCIPNVRGSRLSLLIGLAAVISLSSSWLMFKLKK